MKKTGVLIVLIFSFLFNFQAAYPHCEIPCGIYDDQARVVLIEEHIKTIEKSMNQIKSLSKEQLKNYNQIVRWVTNKETHAQHIQEIVYQYFMTQRIKFVRNRETSAHKEYLEKLSLLHQMLLEAMKAKQTTDLKVVANLRLLLEEFKVAYFGIN